MRTEETRAAMDICCCARVILRVIRERIVVLFNFEKF